MEPNGFFFKMKHGPGLQIVLRYPKSLFYFVQVVVAFYNSMTAHMIFWQVGIVSFYA